ncbi:MAG: sigma-70 family RNA polymerase sigma factor [Erysipelotrichaceae bacterium]
MKKEDRNDNELINLIKLEDEEAFLIMRKKYDRLIYHLAHETQKMYPYVYCSFDDLVQEGNIGFLKAAQTYRIENETKFITYAYTVIKRRMRTYLNNLSHCYSNEYSYDDMAVQEAVSGYRADGYHQNPSTIYFGKYEQQLLMKAYVCLPPLQQEILKYKLQGKTYVEISQLCNINIKKVDNQLQSIKNKLMDKMNQLS